MSITFNSLYKKTKSLLVELSLDTELSNIFESTDINTVFYLDVDMDDENYVVNLSKLLLESSLGQLSSLDEIKDNLTEIQVLAYESTVTVPTSNSKSLYITDLLGSLDYEMSYGSKDTPDERDISLFMYRLKDLIVSKSSVLAYYNNVKDVDLTKCLVSVNGLISRPLFFDDEMFIVNGRHFMDSTTEHNLPDVSLLDFSELGDIEIVPFNKCTLTSRDNENTFSLNTDIAVTLPDGVDISNKSVYVIIANTLQLKYKPSIVDNNSFIISPNLLNIQRSLLKVQNNTEEYQDNSTICVCEDISTYLNETMLSDDHYGAFFLIIDNPKVVLLENSTINFCSDVYSALRTNNILFDGVHNSILSHVEIQYDNNTDFYLDGVQEYFELCDNINDTPRSVGSHLSYSTYKDTRRSTERNMKLIQMVGM